MELPVGKTKISLQADVPHGDRRFTTFWIGVGGQSRWVESFWRDIVFVANVCPAGPAWLRPVSRNFRRLIQGNGTLRVSIEKNRSGASDRHVPRRRIDRLEFFINSIVDRLVINATPITIAD